MPSGILWYNKNIGATNGNTVESWYGNYYAWGEIETKSNYAWGTYKYCTPDYNPSYDTGSLTKYTGSDGKTILETVDDVATITNSAWRIPTNEDFEELLLGTNNSWVENYNDIEGLNGRLFIKNTIIQPAFKNVTLYSSIVEGEVTDEIWAQMSGFTLDELNAMVGGDICTMMFKDAEMSILAEYNTDYGFAVKQTDPSISMFIPAAGNIYGSSDDGTGYTGFIWSSSLISSKPSNARSIYFSNVTPCSIVERNRQYGQSIRPIY